MKNNESILVVKLGGTEGVDFSKICDDIADLISTGQKLIIVHGGSAEANKLGELTGCPPKFVTSPSGFTSRYTNPETLEVFAMAVNGKINTFLVEELQKRGINALGLSGLDGKLICAQRKSAIRIIENGKQKILRDDFTGKITVVNKDLLELLLSNGYTPVIAPMAISEKGEALNVDADRAAAMISSAVKADHLILLTAAAGLMRRFPDESTLIHQLPKKQLDDALDFAKGRMKKKVLGAQEALSFGVNEVVISDGRIDAAVSKALAGAGTHIS
jgi:acetylglutamate/LysW-gamma-L-alpha-aminoadipate kinase